MCCFPKSETTNSGFEPATMHYRIAALSTQPCHDFINNFCKNKLWHIMGLNLRLICIWNTYHVSYHKHMRTMKAMNNGTTILIIKCMIKLPSVIYLKCLFSLQLSDFQSLALNLDVYKWRILAVEVLLLTKTVLYKVVFYPINHDE